MAPKRYLSILAILAAASCSSESQPNGSKRTLNTPTTSADATKAAPSAKVLTSNVSAEQNAAKSEAPAEAPAVEATPTETPPVTAEATPPAEAPKELSPEPVAPSPAPPPANNVVNFSIKPGTAKNGWNTADKPILAKVGQIIRITNNDTITHQMHTGGAPCGHGDPIAPGQSADCKVTKAIDTVAKPGALYDHIAGSASLLYLTAVP